MIDLDQIQVGSLLSRKWRSDEYQKYYLVFRIEEYSERNVYSKIFWTHSLDSGYTTWVFDTIVKHYYDIVEY